MEAGSGAIGVLCQKRMPPDELEKRREELTATLSALDERFAREMRARGFDPAQAENVALTAELARLYAAREEVRTELEDLTAQNDAEN